MFYLICLLHKVALNATGLVILSGDGSLILVSCVFEYYLLRRIDFNSFHLYLEFCPLLRSLARLCWRGEWLISPEGGIQKQGSKLSVKSLLVSIIMEAIVFFLQKH